MLKRKFSLVLIIFTEVMHIFFSHHKHLNVSIKTNSAYRRNWTGAYSLFCRGSVMQIITLIVCFSYFNCLSMILLRVISQKHNPLVTF